MRFIDHIGVDANLFDRPLCPSCVYKSLPGYSESFPIVGIPQPKSPHKFLGVIISEDPTTDFKNVYLNARKNSETWRKELMEAKAPPRWLIEKLQKFDEKFFQNSYADEINRFAALLYDNVYWTHLNKCCTSKQDKNICFRYKNAEVCASNWLKDEILDANDSGAKFIIGLGKPVDSFFSEWREMPHPISEHIFFLPHPSGANNGQWFNERIVEQNELKEKVKSMIHFCNGLE